MKPFLPLLLLVWFTTRVVAQQYRLSTEVQSSFIDITGLFGVKEPASVTQFSYAKKGVGLEVYHSFSLKQVGNTIQTLVIPSYRIRLDSAGRWFLRPKVDLFYNRPAGGAFIRPGVHLICQPAKQHTFSVVSWLFTDLRDAEIYKRRLNGITYYLTYTHTTQHRKWQVSEETRLLYVDVKRSLKVGGIVQNAQLLYKPLQVYVGGTAAYSAYRSDNQHELSWNVNIGKVF